MAAAVLACLLSSSCARLPAPTAPRGASPSAAARAEAAASRGVIAQLQPGVSASDLAASYGSTLLGTIPDLSMALLRTPDGSTDSSFVDRLEHDSRVQFAEPNAEVETAEARQSTFSFDDGTGSWTAVVDQTALARVGAPLAQSLGTGQGVLVAVLDTGIDVDHPALAASLDLPGIEPGVTTDPGDDRPEGVDTNGDGVIDGALGHGTHVAGIVHALAPGARLLAVRVLDSDGVGDAFRVTRGLVMAVDRGAAIANLSLGMTADSRAVRAGLDYAAAAGVLVVAPTGNSDTPSTEFPASVPGVLAVAGTDASDHKASFSNYGTDVGVAAPAVGILSTFWNGGYAVWSGTSMAAPFASGTAALLYAQLGPPAPATAQHVQALVRGGALPLGSIDPTYGTLLGSGRVSAATSMQALSLSLSTAGPTSPPPPIKGH